MANYHLSAKPISRSAGRSATGAAAYRAGVEITDERTGVVHDYTRKAGVEHAELILPGGGTADRAAFWNRIEAHHKRGDAVLAREVEVSLPFELSAEQRQALAVGFARDLADRYGVAADVAIHAPNRKGDERNHHAHIMLTACYVQANGEFGKKAVELDPIHCQRHKLENMADRERARWADLANAALERAGVDARIDHRSLEAQGIEREPTRHLGPTATAIERRTGEPSRKRLDYEREASERLARAREAGELERQAQGVERSIIDLSGDLRAALAERDQAEQRRQAEAGVAAAQARFEARQQAESGIQDALAGFERWKAQRDAERAAQERAEAQRRAEIEAQRQAEREAAQEREGPSLGR